MSAEDVIRQRIAREKAELSRMEREGNAALDQEWLRLKSAGPRAIERLKSRGYTGGELVSISRKKPVTNWRGKVVRHQAVTSEVGAWKVYLLQEPDCGPAIYLYLASDGLLYISQGYRGVRRATRVDVLGELRFEHWHDTSAAKQMRDQYLAHSRAILAAINDLGH